MRSSLTPCPSDFAGMDLRESVLSHSNHCSGALIPKSRSPLSERIYLL